jgi:hypothetical protein
LDLDATIEKIAEIAKLAATHSIAVVSALAIEAESGDAPATVKKTPPITATPSAALICKAELVIPTIMPEPPPGREIWIGYHHDLRHMDRLRALRDIADTMLLNAVMAVTAPG